VLRIVAGVAAAARLAGEGDAAGLLLEFPPRLVLLMFALSPGEFIRDSSAGRANRGGGTGPEFSSSDPDGDRPRTSTTPSGDAGVISSSACAGEKETRVWRAGSTFPVPALAWGVPA